ncbi:transcriptional regulator [Bifidobacterium dolichotidis]|uniref:Transcriptional regulator n=1 Tax=Bifidobacterium dolichotidis TaxID=2306976 RepID=A0A430FSV7_9BIFI|nr:hypothetical protein [Bifidobacterium dolichotidis]RSX55931.1 transcriptional regulator [Bifidobacterium dolichotidis]
MSASEQAAQASATEHELQSSQQQSKHSSHRTRHEQERTWYEWHARTRAFHMANGVGLMLLGTAIGNFMQLLPAQHNKGLETIVDWLNELIGHESYELIHPNTNPTHPESFLVMIAFIIIGSFMVHSCKEDSEQFHDAFPRLNFRYSAEERRSQMQRHLTWTLIAVLGVLICLGLLYFAHLANWPADLIGGLQKLSFAAGAWIVVFAGCWYERCNLRYYNVNSMRYANIYELLDHHTVNGITDTMIIKEKHLCDYVVSLGRVATVAGVLTVAGYVYLPTLRGSWIWIAGALVTVLSLIARYMVLHHVIQNYEK